MSSVLGSKTLTDEILLTVFAEVESFLNAQPLTYVSSDPEDSESLTPNYLNNFLRKTRVECSSWYLRSHRSFDQTMANTLSNCHPTFGTAY